MLLTETECQHCGDDAKPRYQGACMDCSDVNDWPQSWPLVEDEDLL